MRAVVLQSNYLPWKGYFDLIQGADVFVYYDEVQYTKNDWRNRNRICSKNGVQWLTIPISRESVKLRMSEVRLPDARWQTDHFKTLVCSYRPARCFHQIEGFGLAAELAMQALSASWTRRTTTLRVIVWHGW